MVQAPEMRRLPRQVDVSRLCQQGQILEGFLSLEALPRVMQALPTRDGLAGSVLQTVLRFAVDNEGYQVMSGNFATRLPVVCQRCLEVMDYPVRADFHCAFVVSDDRAKALPAHLDPVILEAGSSQVELYDLLEDELLLNLPIAAFHERCDGDGSTKIFGEPEGQVVAEGGRKPFAALAGLLNRQSLEKE